MSILPPRTRAKLDRLPRSARMEYAQGLKGKYEYRRNHLQSIADKIAIEWSINQSEHLDRCIAELDDILAD